MSLSIGIVGLPNVGKSTLFNALLKKQAALAANYPFATIEPNVGIVDVPDQNLHKLFELEIKNGHEPNIVPAVVKFFDIAGLVAGAHKGEGLGNKFLSHIREVDAILHLIRDFNDNDVIKTGFNPREDKEIIETELILADLQTVENRIENSRKERDKLPILNLIKETLEKGIMVNEIKFKPEELSFVKTLNLLSTKPVIYVVNVDEDKLSTQSTTIDHISAIRVSAKIESELASFTQEDKTAYLNALGINESGLDLVIKKSYEILGLQTFYTSGPKEVRAWTIKKGSKAPQAAGVIHTDFERGFIRAEVVAINALLQHGNIKLCKEKGLVRSEGKDYVMREGDVVEFRFNV